MIGLFTNSTTQNRHYELPRLNHVKKGVSEEIHKLTEYIKERQLTFNNKHIVLKIMETLNVSMRCDAYMYVDKVRYSSRQIASALGLTSSTNYGVIHKPGYFINANSNEIIISNTEDFDIDYALKNWERLAPIKFLSHFNNDISYGIPSGNYQHNDENGIVVVSINIPMLALQYRCWLLAMHKRGLDYVPKLETFVLSYPLINLTKSHADIAMFNRLYNEVCQYKNNGFVRRNPLALIDYHNRINSVIDDYKKIILRTPMDFETLIDNIPTLFYKNFHNASRLPNVAQTRQIRWAFLIAKLRLFHFLLLIDSKNNSYSNREHVNDIKNVILEMENDNEIAKYFTNVETNLLSEIKNLLI